MMSVKDFCAGQTAYNIKYQISNIVKAEKMRKRGIKHD